MIIFRKFQQQQQKSFLQLFASNKKLQVKYIQFETLE